MLVVVLGLVQADFHLQVRKADLAVISMKELGILMNAMEVVTNATIEIGYIITLKVQLDGVMISINA